MSKEERNRRFLADLEAGMSTGELAEKYGLTRGGVTSLASRLRKRGVQSERGPGAMPGGTGLRHPRFSSPERVPRTPLAVHIPVTLDTRLREYARERGLSLATVVRQALEGLLSG